MRENSYNEELKSSISEEDSTQIKEYIRERVISDILKSTVEYVLKKHRVLKNNSAKDKQIIKNCIKSNAHFSRVENFLVQSAYSDGIVKEIIDLMYNKYEFSIDNNIHDNVIDNIMLVFSNLLVNSQSQLENIKCTKLERSFDIYDDRNYNIYLKYIYNKAVEKNKLRKLHHFIYPGTVKDTSEESRENMVQQLSQQMSLAEYPSTSYGDFLNPAEYRKMIIDSCFFVLTIQDDLSNYHKTLQDEDAKKLQEELSEDLEIPTLSLETNEKYQKMKKDGVVTKSRGQRRNFVDSLNLERKTPNLKKDCTSDSLNDLNIPLLSKRENRDDYQKTIKKANRKVAPATALDHLIERSKSENCR